MQQIHMKCDKVKVSKVITALSMMSYTQGYMYVTKFKKLYFGALSSNV